MFFHCLRCELCNIFTPDANILAIHMEGKNHVKRLKAAAAAAGESAATTTGITTGKQAQPPATA
jgi:hypothetical protein